jgi:hypothetical protein
VRVQAQASISLSLGLFSNSGNPPGKGVICDTYLVIEKKKINQERTPDSTGFVPYFSMLLICALFSEW